MGVPVRGNARAGRGKDRRDHGTRRILRSAVDPHRCAERGMAAAITVTAAAAAGITALEQLIHKSRSAP